MNKNCSQIIENDAVLQQLLEIADKPRPDLRDDDIIGTVEYAWYAIYSQLKENYLEKKFYFSSAAKRFWK